MGLLFSNIDEIQAVTSVMHNLRPEVLYGFERIAIQKILHPYLGSTYVDELIAAYAGTPSPMQLKVIELIQGALINYSIYKAIPALNVQLTQGGILQQHSETLKPAFSHSVDNLESSLIESAYDYLDLLLDFLEKNKADIAIATWTNSTFYDQSKDSFINNAIDFNGYFNIKFKCITYRALRPVIIDMETFSILPHIGQPFFDELKNQIKTSTISVLNAKVLRILNLALANYSIHHAIKMNWCEYTPNGIMFKEFLSGGNNSQSKTQRVATENQLHEVLNTIWENAERYMSQLLDYLNKNLNDYPLYRDNLPVVEEINNCKCDDYIKKESSIIPFF